MNEPTVQLIGNLTTDVELRFTPSGKPVARIDLACNPRRYDQNTKQWVDGTPSFWTCEAWGPIAENAMDSLTKGDRVIVTGRIRADVYTPDTGPNAGVEQRRHRVVIDELGASLRFTAVKPVRANRATTNGADADTSDDAPF